MKEIKNIIFDLGGVILNIDFKLTFEAFRKLGLENFNEIYSKLQQTDLFNQFEIGRITPDEFRLELLKHCRSGTDFHQIDAAWNTLLLDLPKERLELLNILNKKYRMILLSNTNEIHIKELAVRLNKQYGFNSLSHLFEKIYYSFEIGCRKPDKQSYAYVLEENGLLPDETLFIDDNHQNIDGAISLGIHGIYIKPYLTINQLFGNSGLMEDEYKRHLISLNI
jgi:putative hydrolase of the HAD superfamily